MEESPVQLPIVKPAKKQKVSQEKDSFDTNSIHVMVIKETFNLNHSILSIFKSSQGIMWGLMMVIMCQVALSRAAAVPQGTGPVQTLTPDAF